MYLSFRYLVVLSVLNTGFAQKQVNTKCNQRNLQKVDQQMASLLPFLSGDRMPENENQLGKYCTSITESIDSATDYVKSCGGTFGPFMAKMVINEYKRGWNSICKSSNDKQVREFLSAGKCTNSVTNKLQKCLNNLLDSLTTLQAVSFEDRVSTGCCQSFKIVSCIQKAVLKSKRCDRNLVARVEKMIFEELGDFCGIYFSNNEKCNKLVAKTPKLNDTYVRPKSLFPPIMGLMDSFRNMKCTALTEQKMDSFLEQLITIGTPDVIPETSQQMSKWCTKAKQYIPYMYGYVESCVSDFGKMMAKVMVGSAANSFQPYCGESSINILDNPSPQMREYIKAAKCGNRAENKLKVCFDEFNTNIMGITGAPEMSRIKMACCNAYNFRTCIFNTTLTTKGCSPQTIEWAERQVLNTAQPAINMVCNDLWGNSQKCDKLMADIPKMDPKTYLKPKSPFFPMIRMLDSFPDVNY